MTQRLRRLTVGRAFAVAGAVLAIVATSFVVIGALALNRLTDSRRQIAEVIEVAQDAASRLRTALVDEETGVRGFVLGGDPAFLVPYENGLAQERRNGAILTRLVDADDGFDLPRERLAAVFGTMETWRRAYAEPAITAVREQRESALDATAVADGKVRFDAVRGALLELDESLRAERTEARADLSADARRVNVVFFGFSGLLLVAGLAVALALRSGVTNPLGRIGRQVRAVAAGDFARPITGGGPADIRALADDVDSMRRRIVAEVDALEAATEALERQREDLERSNDELEQFAYVASHDLQEPLRKVASFSQLLQRRYGGQLDERADQYIEFAVDGAQRMQVLINDLLAFSRVGRMGDELILIDLDVVLDQSLASLATAVEEAGATIERDPLPTVRGALGLLATVLQNLVGNAIKFRGDQAPRIRIGCETDGDHYALHVTDDGIGIDPEYAERIFVIFQRLHTKEQYAGTGIGLAMCRKIVEYHGGRIWLDADASTSGHGTTVRFTLPIPTEEPSTHG